MTKSLNTVVREPKTPSAWHSGPRQLGPIEIVPATSTAGNVWFVLDQYRQISVCSSEATANALALKLFFKLTASQDPRRYGTTFV